MTSDFYSNKDTSSQEVMPDQIYEHLIASQYGWTLEYIRALSSEDFNTHKYLCEIRAKFFAIVSAAPKI